MSDPKTPTPRFVCHVCKRVFATDKPHKQCEYCGEECVTLKEWVRHQAKKKK